MVVSVFVRIHVRVCALAKVSSGDHEGVFAFSLWLLSYVLVDASVLYLLCAASIHKGTNSE